MSNPNSAAFPTAIATDSTLMVAKARALSTLVLPINSIQTSFDVLEGTKYLAPCLVQVDTEVIFVGNISGNTLQSCVRGFLSTFPNNHNQNAQVKGYVMDYHHNQVAAEIKAIETFLGVDGSNIISGNQLYTLTFSTTPIFNFALGNVQILTLTGNVTSSTTSNIQIGENSIFVFQQDSMGGRSFVWPPNVIGGFDVGSMSANQIAIQSFLSLDGIHLYATGACILEGQTAGGDLNGQYPNPTVNTVGGLSSTTIATGVDAAINATPFAIANKIGLRDLNGACGFSRIFESVSTVTFSSVPQFDLSLGSIQVITLTGNVSASTCINLVIGQSVKFVFIQDSVGNRTFTWPMNVFGGINVALGTSNKVCIQEFFSFDGVNLYAQSLGMII